MARRRPANWASNQSRCVFFLSCSCCVWCWKAFERIPLKHGSVSLSRPSFTFFVAPFAAGCAAQTRCNALRPTPASVRRLLGIVLFGALLRRWRRRCAPVRRGARGKSAIGKPPHTELVQIVACGFKGIGRSVFWFAHDLL